MSEGKTVTLLPSSKQDEIRRVAKAGRRRKGSKGLQGSDLFTLIAEDRRSERKRLAEKRVAAKERQEERQLLFRIRQAELASEDASYTNLRPGSVARNVACEMLLAFPDVEVPQGTTRCKRAEQKALEVLELDQLKHSKAIGLGVSTAKVCLSKAYTRLTATADEAVAS